MGLSFLAKMKMGIGAGLLTVASAAQGQFISPDVDVQSAAGILSVVDSGDGFSRNLVVGERVFFDDGERRFIGIEDQRGSLYLISLSSGGNACEVSFVWLHTVGGARLSPEFGNCAAMTEVRSDAETVSVVMPSTSAAEGFVAFVYDGKAIERVVLGQQVTGVPFEADALVGRYPYEIFRDAGWRASLLALMGESGYQLAGDVIATASPMEVQGDWVAGSGFNNRMAGNAYGATAIHRTDHRVVVAIRTQEGGLQVWGNLSGAMPQEVQVVLEGR
ncbi:MAG: hypothetical protein KIH44_010465 [Octadecabacter sp.]|nr:hypothetical protein [Octadecabacter sp.]